MDKLMKLVDQYNMAKAAWDNHTQTYYAPWQLDAPLTPGERRADEDMRRHEQKLRDRLMDAEAAVIAEAQNLRLTYQPGKA